jgi:hypothetical protein
VRAKDSLCISAIAGVSQHATGSCAFVVLPEGADSDLNQFRVSVDVPGHLFFFKCEPNRCLVQADLPYLSTHLSHTLVSLFLRVYQPRHSCRSSYPPLLYFSTHLDCISRSSSIDCFLPFLWNICTHHHYHHHGPLSRRIAPTSHSNLPCRQPRISLPLSTCHSLTRHNQPFRAYSSAYCSVDYLA